MKLGNLLNTKDPKYRVLVSIQPNETVLRAVHLLANHDRGSIVVCDEDGKLLGIITERDIVRKCAISGCDLDKTKVKDVMTTRIVVAKPEDDLNYAINAMKEARIRHIPIIDEEEKALGMISMRDLLGVQLQDCDAIVRVLNDYIFGT